MLWDRVESVSVAMPDPKDFKFTNCRPLPPSKMRADRSEDETGLFDVLWGSNNLGTRQWYLNVKDAARAANGDDEGVMDVGGKIYIVIDAGDLG